MNKKELARTISAEMKMPQKDVIGVLKCFESEITKSLGNGECVKLQGLGTFDVRKRKARVGVNPKNGNEMRITEAVVPLFRPSQSLKLRINDIRA